jgi:hypothetical protein
MTAIQQHVITWIIPSNIHQINGRGLSVTYFIVIVIMLIRIRSRAHVVVNVTGGAIEP